MNAVTITAKRWSGGWELWSGDDCWTQVATLDKARQQVVDYLDTVDEGIDHTEWDITIIPGIGPLADDVREARESTDAAAALVAAAASKSRAVVRELRAQGYSVTDTAAILGVSRGRVSQLTRM